MRYFLLATLFVFIQGCSSSPEFGVPDIELFSGDSEKVEITLDVASDINPDQSGRPSPLVLKVFQLTNDVQFRDAQLDKLLDSHASVLGADMRDVDQMTIFPGRSNTYQLTVFKETRFIGILAAFQDEVNSRPKRIYAYDGNKPADLCITISRLDVSVSGSC
ncbi:type VI secretion system lipoprotein TssJ [Aestuariibacter salexigens]|uniref:type VI secretion system lipoprotein TssJ n=1 Tax=Aestuariibacter salexigens TaxID=226010 RepID=UPI0003FFAB54|nr:type VI secretion system lipoprotein TssJ [Aestuariibacter salexigens]